MVTKKCKICGIKYKYCECFLEHKNLKDDLIEHKGLSCSKTFDEKLKEIFFNKHKFSNHKFILLL